MALYSHQLIDLNPEQNQPVDAVSGSERVDENQTGSKKFPPGNSNQEVKTTIEDESITEESQGTTTVVENITVSGSVGTEFGERIAGETVVLYSPYLGARYSIVTGISGEFIFTDLKPSWDYVLKVSPQGMFGRYTKSPIKLQFDQEIHNVILQSIPLGVLTGRIADPYGRPVTGIKLIIKTVEIDSWSTDVLTGANGIFSVAEFPKGRFGLSIEGRQSLRASGLNFDPDAGEPIKLTIDLGPYNLIGRIYDASGQTFDGARVFLNWALQENGVRIRSTRQVSADARGRFRFTGLGPGDHELVVSAWKVDAFGHTTKQTVRQTVNMGVDSGVVSIFFGAP